MNILYARGADFDFPEANKVQVANMCKAFRENGCDVTLIAFGKNHQEIINRYGLEEIRTIFIKNKIRFFILGDLILFFNYLKYQNKFDFIHTRDIIFAILVKLFFKNKKVFLEIHNVPEKIWWKAIFRKFTPKLDKIIVISNGLQSGLAKLGICQKNIIVMHDAVNLKDFDIPLSKKEARKKLGLPLEKPIISYVGSTDKNHDMLAFIEAAKKLNDVYFVVFGREESYLNDAASSIPNFIFKGYLNKPSLAYAATDILFAGYTERVPWIEFMSPLKIFEYMITKKPALIADFPRTREIVSDNEAYFYRAEDAKDIARKIEFILNNREESDKKCANAFRKGKNCTWLKRAKKIISLMEHQ